MKSNHTIYKVLSLLLISVLFLTSNIVQAQDNGKEKKKSNAFIVFAGLSFNDLSGDTDLYQSSLSPGYQLGVSYKRGRFFYWQIGALYNTASYSLTGSKINPDGSSTDDSFTVSELDIPINVGINILSVTDRVVGLRAFIGAVPAFALGVGSNDLGITKDDINTFNVDAQIGIGVDILFIVIETGFNYGFVDLFKDDIPSKPTQIWVKLGFRF